MCDAPSVTSMGQTGTTLGTTTGQNLAAVGSSHSLAETVNHGTVTLAGLVGTMRDSKTAEQVFHQLIWMNEHRED